MVVYVCPSVCLPLSMCQSNSLRVPADRENKEKCKYNSRSEKNPAQDHEI